MEKATPKSGRHSSAPRCAVSMGNLDTNRADPRQHLPRRQITVAYHRATSPRVTLGRMLHEEGPQLHCHRLADDSLRALAHQVAQFVPIGWIRNGNRCIFVDGGASSVCCMTGLLTTLFQQECGAFFNSAHTPDLSVTRLIENPPRRFIIFPSANYVVRRKKPNEDYPQRARIVWDDGAYG